MTFENAKVKFAIWLKKAGIDYETTKHGGISSLLLYDDEPINQGHSVVYELTGENIRLFLDYATNCDISSFVEGESHLSRLIH
jgi:hypothetical protein